MLVIREEQIDALLLGDEERLIGTIIIRITREDPELAEKNDDETLRKKVRSGIERARGHGFESARDISDFVSLMFEVAPNFDEQPEIKRVLDDKGVPPGERLEKARSTLVPETAWEEARENYDERAWRLEDEAATGSGEKPPPEQEKKPVSDEAVSEAG